jgi:Smg protein
MFEVLAYVFENYANASSALALPALHRKLHQMGFATEEIEHALLWLEDMKQAARQLGQAPQRCAGRDLPSQAMRVLTRKEQKHLGLQSWGYLTYLQSIGVLTGERLELVLERVLGVPGSPLPLADLKLVVLMVYWSRDEEPDALVLDELCDNDTDRVAH